MHKTVILIGALTGVLATAYCSLAHAEDEKPLFIQVNLVKGLPAEADPGADPGRVEVTIRGEFVGCATAPAYTNHWGELMLAPVSLGFKAIGRQEDVKVQLHGELGRWARPSIVITEMGK